MAIQVSLGDPIRVHVVYMDEPVSQVPPVVTISNPDVADVEENPQFPGDQTYRLVIPVRFGKFVIGVSDGVLQAALPEMDVVNVGEAASMADQHVILG